MKRDTYKPEINKKEEADFVKSMSEGRKKSEHKHFFDLNLKEFEKYKSSMNENLIKADTDNIDTIYKVRMTYQLKRNVWREFEIYEYQKLSDLSEAIIDSMGWLNDHLHSWWFKGRHGKEVRYWYNMYEICSTYTQEESYPVINDEMVCMANINFDLNKKIGYAFDFGDDHRFILELKSKRKETKRDNMKPFPLLVDQRGVAPEQYPQYFEEEGEE